MTGNGYEYMNICYYTIYYKRKTYFERYLTPALFSLYFLNLHAIFKYEDYGCCRKSHMSRYLVSKVSHYQVIVLCSYLANLSF